MGMKMSNKAFTDSKTKGASPAIPSERRGANPGNASPSQLTSPVNPKPLIPSEPAKSDTN